MYGRPKRINKDDMDRFFSPAPDGDWRSQVRTGGLPELMGLGGGIGRPGVQVPGATPADGNGMFSRMLLEMIRNGKFAGLLGLGGGSGGGLLDGGLGGGGDDGGGDGGNGGNDDDDGDGGGGGDGGVDCEAVPDHPDCPPYEEVP